MNNLQLDTSKMTADQYAELYRDYFNNFLTLECFADHYGINEHTACHIIKEGYHQHEMGVLKVKLRCIQEDAFNCSGCSDEDVLKDSLLDISEQLNVLIEPI